MEKKNITRAYWKIVWEEVKKTAWKESDMRGHLIGFVGILILGAIFSLLYIAGIVSINMFDNVIANVGFEAMTILIPVAFFTISLVVALAEMPARIFEKQGGFIENPFELRSRPPLPKYPHEFRWASITVKNMTRINIDGCFLTLDDILDADGKSILFSRQRRLSWSSGEGLDGNSVNKELTIIPSEPRVCDVATTWPNNTEAMFTVWRGTQVVSIGIYQVIVSVHGQWNGKAVDKSQHFSLEYQGGNDLTIREKGERKWAKHTKRAKEKNKREPSRKTKRKP